MSCPLLLLLLAPVLAGEDTSFGTDVSAGASAGALLGEWPVAGVHTAWQLKLDAFPTAREAPGPRVGASVFAGGSAGIRQDAREAHEDQVARFPFSYVHWGVLAAIRPDPARTWGGLPSFWFGRIDHTEYWGAPYALPMATLEAGARKGTGRSDRPLFLDLVARVSWGSARGPGTLPGGALDDWWLVQGGLSVGTHAR